MVLTSPMGDKIAMNLRERRQNLARFHLSFCTA